MKKNLGNITEELMMKYLEGDLSSEECYKFERIMSQNDYLNNRVNSLRSILENEPKISPPQEVHDKILTDLNIINHQSHVSAKKYINNIIGFFENRPFALASVMSGLLVAFILILNTGSNIETEESSIEISGDINNLDKEDHEHIIDDESLQ